MTTILDKLTTCWNLILEQINTADYFLPSTIKLWNNLPLTLRKTESLSIFNKHLKNQNAKVPTYYYIGSRIGQILRARLRMNSSSLNGIDIIHLKHPCKYYHKLTPFWNKWIDGRTEYVNFRFDTEIPYQK